MSEGPIEDLRLVRDRLLAARIAAMQRGDQAEAERLAEETRALPRREIVLPEWKWEDARDEAEATAGKVIVILVCGACRKRNILATVSDARPFPLFRTVMLSPELRQQLGDEKQGRGPVGYPTLRATVLIGYPDPPGFSSAQARCRTHGKWWGSITELEGAVGRYRDTGKVQTLAVHPKP